ncbi:MAG: hypothetical protein PVG73_03495 [Desulfobacterales bacterium]|jgi:hypothetical protein
MGVVDPFGVDSNFDVLKKRKMHLNTTVSDSLDVDKSSDTVIQPSICGYCQ